MEDIILLLKETFELANNAKKFIDEIFLDIKKSKNHKDSGQLASSGNFGQLASSGDYGKLASSGNSGQLASSGDSGKLASSGDSGKLASSGDYGQLASSGDYGKLASSGDYGQLVSTGKKTVIAAIGFYDIVKAKIGSWITLAEYRKNENDIYEVYHVQTEYVDGDTIKEDTFYCIYDKKFREYIKADGVESAIINKKHNVYKVVNFGDNKKSYLIEENGVYAHGETIGEARDSFKYKISNRDPSVYKNMTIDTILTIEEAIKMYRVITGSCESGVRSFVQNANYKKSKISIKQIIELTADQYGNKALKDFFNKIET